MERKPLYHFTVREGSLNDPNGLCYYKGKWHLFYQLLREGQTWHWGHAVSDDLVRWTELPDAIVPEDDGLEEECWSGSTCVHGDTVAALYFGYHGKQGLYCRKGVGDDLLSFERVGASPAVLCGGTGEEYTRIPYAVYPAVYDPCLFYGDGTYYALSGGVSVRHGVRCREEYLYRSKDLISWEYLHPFLKNDRFGTAGDDGACPNFVPFGQGHLLLTYSHANGPEFMTGIFDKSDLTFDVTGGGRLNPTSKSGGYMAPTACADPSGNGSVRAFYVMPRAGLDHCLSLPHTLTPDSRGTGIAVSPAEELKTLRRDARTVPGFTLEPGREYVINEAAGDTKEIEVTVCAEPETAVQFRLMRSDGGDRYAALTFYPGRGASYRGAKWWTFDNVLTLDTFPLSSDPLVSAPESVTFEGEAYTPVTLRIFIDRTVIEVFTATGQALGRRALPLDGNEMTFSVLAPAGHAKITGLTAYRMGF